MGRAMKSPIKFDESVTFYTSAAWPSRAKPGAWELEIHGVIFEEESRPLIRALGVKALRLRTELLTELERDVLRERLKLFLVDNERGKAVPVRVGSDVHVLPKSGANGHFINVLTLAGDAVAAALQDGRIPLQAVTRPGDERQFTGAACVLPDSEDPLVISDVDDTIKITSIGNFEEVKLNTFCRPFLPVEGMAGVYQAWAEAGAGFCYVTGSPWQLYRPLEAFRERHGFPAGPWHMKHLRFAEPATIWAFVGTQNEFKRQRIEPLMERWSQRPVVLVGDSSEQDPEIFAALARKHPKRVMRIFIRDVAGGTRDSDRYRKTFEGIDEAKWQLFQDAAELPRRLS
jgi:phosphatidate phosphatase APP1